MNGRNARRRRRTRIVSAAVLGSALTVLVLATGAMATHLTSITLGPASQTVTAGDTATFSGTVDGTSDAPECTYGATLSVSGAPPGSTTTLTPDSKPTGFPATMPYTLDIDVPATDPGGSYSVTVRADWIGVEGCDLSQPFRTATVTLDVTPRPRGGEFSCTSTALAKGQDNSGAFGPIAGPTAPDARPCYDDNDALTSVTVPLGSGKIVAKTLSAYTVADPDDTSASAPAAGDMGFSAANVEWIKITNGTSTIVIRRIRSTANTICTADGEGGLYPKQRSTSSAANVTVNGVRRAVGTQEVNIPIPGGTLRINQPGIVYDNGTRSQIVRTAVKLDFPGFENDIHVARSKSDYSYDGAGNPCVVV
jgi:hypothetical protein